MKDVSTLALSYTELVLGESNILNESDRYFPLFVCASTIYIVSL